MRASSCHILGSRDGHVPSRGLLHGRVHGAGERLRAGYVHVRDRRGETRSCTPEPVLTSGGELNEEALKANCCNDSTVGEQRVEFVVEAAPCNLLCACTADLKSCPCKFGDGPLGEDPNTDAGRE